MKHLFVIVFFLAFLPSASLLAQYNRPLRIEMEVKTGEEPFRLVPCGENGLILFAQTNKIEKKDNTVWSFIFYDKNLKNIGQVFFPIPRFYDFSDYEVADNELYMCFNSSRSSKGDECMLLFIDPVKFFVTSIPFKVPEKSNVSAFKVVGDYAFVSLVSKNNKFYVVKVNMNDGTFSTIVEEKADTPSLLSLLVEKKKQAITLLVQKEERRGVFTFSTYSYDFSGARIGQRNYTGFNKNYFVVSAELFRNDHDELLAIGSYNDEPEHRFGDYFSNGTETSGYFSGVLAAEDSKVEYRKFSSISNYHGYFSDRSSILQGNSKNRTKRISDMSYTAVTQNIHKIDSIYYYIAETYVPEYHRNYRQIYSFYSSIPTAYSDYPILDGYRFISAMAVALNGKGNVKWSSAMEIRDVFSKYIYPRMNLVLDGDNAVLSYSTKSKVLSKVVNGPDAKTGIEQMSILPDKARDEIMDDYNNGMSYWYGSYFLAFGYQQIRNNYISENKRTVFYVNKLAFR